MRSMFSGVRRRFRRSPSTAIAVAALVFAMLGGAYASSNPDGKPTASATKQGKAARGPKGPKGPAGPQGPVGPAGANGSNGTNGSAGLAGKTGETGTNGKNGVSVTSTEFTGATGTCADGGTEFEASNGVTYACNGKEGKEGNPWALDGVLPKGATETGSWTVLAPGSLVEEPEEGKLERMPFAFATASLSFAVPLASEIEEANVHFLEPGDPSTTDCPGTVKDPKAKEGSLCIYANANTSAGHAVKNPETGIANTAGTTGVGMVFFGPPPVQGEGTYAVTGTAAPAP